MNVRLCVERIARVSLSWARVAFVVVCCCCCWPLLSILTCSVSLIVYMWYVNGWANVFSPYSLLSVDFLRTFSSDNCNRVGVLFTAWPRHSLWALLGIVFRLLNKSVLFRCDSTLFDAAQHIQLTIDYIQSKKAHVNKKWMAQWMNNQI